MTQGALNGRPVQSEPKCYTNTAVGDVALSFVELHRGHTCNTLYLYLKNIYKFGSLPVIGKKTGSPSDSTGTSIQMLYWSEGLVKYYNGKNNLLQVNRHNVCILSLDY